MEILALLSSITGVELLPLFSPSFWQQTLLFIFLFWGLILSFGLPIMLFVLNKPKRKFLVWWPLLGFAHLLTVIAFLSQLRLVSFTLHETFFWDALWIYAGLLVVGSIWNILQRRQELLELLKALDWRMFLGLFLLWLSIFILWSTQHFSVAEQVFFVPGYELNHDSINIAMSVPVLKNNFVAGNSFADMVGSKIDNLGYPLGGSYLLWLFSDLLGTNAYFIFSRLLAAGFLLIFFSTASLLWGLFGKEEALSAWLFWLAVVASGLNYLSVSIVNTSILGISLMLPLFVLSSGILVLWLKKDLRDAYAAGLLFLTLSASFFLYYYLPLLVLTALLPAIWWFYRKSISLKKMFWVAGVPVLAATTLPYRLLSLPRFFQKVPAGNTGNLPGFPHLLQIFSLWFSHPNYLMQKASTFNVIMFILLSLIGMLLIIRGFKVEREKSRIYFLSAILVTLTLLFIYTGILVDSPYQLFKVSQLFSVLWPTLLLLLFAPVLLGVESTYLGVKLFVGLVLSLTILSGLYTFRYVKVPVVASSVELSREAEGLCQKMNRPLLYVGRDEWTAYFLHDCYPVNYYFHRWFNFERLVEMKEENELLNLTDSCSEGSLDLTGPLPKRYNLVLLDACFKFEEEEFEVVEEWQVYKLLERKR